MLVSVTLKESIYASLVVTSHFHQRGVRTGHVDVLLGLRTTTESAEGLVDLLCERTPFSKIRCMGHPVEDVFHPPAYHSGGFACGVRQSGHERSTKFCPTHRFVGIQALHVPRRGISPEVKVLSAFWERAMEGGALR
jgi:hypothetical protein